MSLCLSIELKRFFLRNNWSDTGQVWLRPLRAELLNRFNQNILGEKFPNSIFDQYCFPCWPQKFEGFAAAIVLTKHLFFVFQIFHKCYRNDFSLSLQLNASFCQETTISNFISVLLICQLKKTLGEFFHDCTA